MKALLKVCIWGYNQKLVDAISKNESVEVKGFYDPTSKLSGPNVKIYESFQEMIGEVDAVIICNNKYITCDILSTISEKNKHILLQEKLVCPSISISGYQRFFKDALENKLCLMHCENPSELLENSIDKFISDINNGFVCMGEKEFF